MKKITVIGGGPGNEAYILPAARQKAAACDMVTAQSVRGFVSPARREEAGSKTCTQRSVLA